MVEMIVGMAIGYLAFTEQGHKVGNWVASAAVAEGKKLIEKRSESQKKEKEEKTDEN